MKVFLGGTYANTTWRDELIPLLDGIPVFNPIVEDWTTECIILEEIEKKYKCNIHLYVLTSEMEGVYSIAEAAVSSMKGPTTIVQVMPDGFTEGQMRSLNATLKLLELNGAYTAVSNNISTAANIINALNI